MRDTAEEKINSDFVMKHLKLAYFKEENMNHESLKIPTDERV